MFIDLEVGAGLDLVLWFQDNRLPPLDLLAMALHYAGAELLLLGLVPLIYWSFNRELGLRLLFALIFIGLLNSVVKLLIAAPRPSTVSDLVMPLVEPVGYGFPSGHVMVAVGVWGTAAYQLRWRWLTALVIAGALLMAWSRVYVGVHYPQDVVGGLFFGLLGLWIYNRWADPWLWLWRRLPTRAQASAVFLAGLVPFVFLFDDYVAVALTGMLLGSGAGVIIEARLVRFAVPDGWQRRLLTYAFGIILSLVIFTGLRAIFGTLTTEGTAAASFMRMLRYLFFALAALALWPWLTIRLGLTGQRPPPIHDEQTEGGPPG